MKTVVDYIKDDPCHGCRHAVLIPEQFLDNVFSRRFGCVNKKKRDWLLGKAKEAISEDTSPKSAKLALNRLETVVAMDDHFEKYGFYDCGYANPGPTVCFEGDAEAGAVDAEDVKGVEAAAGDWVDEEYRKIAGRQVGKTYVNKGGV